MNKDELIHEISNRTGFTIKDSEEFLNTFIEILRDTIRNHIDFFVRGLGKIKYTTVKEHEGRKPTPGVKGKSEIIMIPEMEKISFKLSSDLRYGNEDDDVEA
jgi:nucleoid DNA-binding protein